MSKILGDLPPYGAEFCSQCLRGIRDAMYGRTMSDEGGNLLGHAEWKGCKWKAILPKKRVGGMPTN